MHLNRATGVMRLALLAMQATCLLRADGGALLMRQPAGPFIVSVFATPPLPRAGPVDFTVLLQASGSLTGNTLGSGQKVTITFASINASAPPDSNGEDGYIWIAYTTSSGGSDCVGAVSTLTNCSFFTVGYVNLNT